LLDLTSLGFDYRKSRDFWGKTLLQFFATCTSGKIPQIGPISPFGILIHEMQRVHMPPELQQPATGVPQPGSGASLTEAIANFLFTRRAGNRSDRTLEVYDRNLRRFAVAVSSNLSECTPMQIQRHLMGLGTRMRPISVHQHYRVLRTFFNWTVDAGLLASDPMRSIPRPRIPLALPNVPTEEELRAVLASCTATFEGDRNSAMILVMADAGLRAGEVVRARVRDWDLAKLSIVVRLGKGQKDRVTFVSPTTADAIRQHLAMRPDVGDADCLFADARGRPIKLRHLAQILHRLSRRAGLPLDRRLHPHALRHFAATAWLRNGMGVDQARRLLGHTDMSMTLRYSSLVAADLQRAHREAAAIERLGLVSGSASRTRSRRLHEIASSTK
jgi:site-specific recombinase XerD